MRNTILSLGGVLLLTFQTVIAHTTRVESSIQPQTGLIRVWKIGSPHSGALPDPVIAPTLQHEAEKLGYTIEVEALTAAGFATRFSEALDQHNEPEAIAFDNFGVLIGITTLLGHFDGILADWRVPSSLVWAHESLAALQPRGWVMLVRTARNYEAAKSLALRQPACDSAGSGVVNGLTQDELGVVQETASAVARAYLTCDATLLASLSDEARLGKLCFMPMDDSRVDTLNVCSVSGNSNLIFAPIIASFAAERRTPAPLGRHWVPPGDLGHQSLLAILGRTSGGWRLLAISADVLLVVDPAMPLKIRRLGSLLVAGATDQEGTMPAQLLTADGVYPAPTSGQRFGDFFWRPSPSADVIGQVAEFNIGSSERQLTRLFFLLDGEGQISSGFLLGGGRTPTQWRVWSITRGGGVAFSEQRSFAN